MIRWIAQDDALSPSPWRGGSGWGAAAAVGSGTVASSRASSEPSCTHPIPSLPLEGREGGFEPIVWVARHAAAERQSLPPAEAADLADAALAKRGGGGGRVLRRRMLRALIAGCYGLHPAAVRFARDSRGAPRVEGLPVFVSTAGCEHGGEAWSIVAAAERPVGVDLEPWTDRDETACWTLIEAYLKALGRGLTTAPEGVQVHQRADGWRLAVHGAPDGHGEVLAVGALAVAVVIVPAAPRQDEEGRL